MKYLELSYSSFGSLMGGNYNGKFADLNQISQIIFDIIQESETPPKFFRFHTPQNYSSPETIKNFLANFSETYLRDLREILIYKGVNLIVKGDSYKYNLRENKMNKETLRMQMLSGIITEGEYAAAINQEIENTEKDSLNEHYVAGGIVGIGAVTQIPSREKTDYEMAFEHFLGERYETKFENREQDIEEGKEVEEPSLYEGDLNESNIDQMTAGIKDAFDGVRSLPLPDNAKLGIAKTGIGIATLNAIEQKISAGQNISPEGQARLQKAITTIKQATSIEEIEQALLDAVINYASTNKPESSLEEISMDGGQSISQIQDEWLQVTNDIARLAAEYKKPKPDMQAALALGDQLKAKARLKQKLENEINNNIAGNDRDIRLIITQLT